MTAARPDPVARPTLRAFAAWAFAAWIAASLLIGEHFPCSRFAMYAEMPAGPTAVPVLQVGGVDADPADFRGYTGFDTPPLPPPAPCALGWQMDALRAAIDRRRGSEGGPLAVALGYRVYVPGAAGPAVEAEFVPVATGRAWPP